MRSSATKITMAAGVALNAEKTCRHTVQHLPYIQFLFGHNRDSGALFIALFAFVMTAVHAQTHHGAPSFSAVYALDFPSAAMTVRVTNDSGIVTYDSKITGGGLAGKLFAGEIASRSAARRNDRGILLPLRCDYAVAKQPGRNRSYRFDWAQKQALLRHEGEEDTVALTDDVTDENILLLRLAEEVGALGTRFDKTYRILTRGRIKQRHFAAVGREQLATALGALDTIKVERRKRGTADRMFWLSSAHHFLPVKVEWRKGDKVKQTLSVLELKTS